MGTRYLYGDSEPFPGDHDFLATLRSFVKNAGRAALVHSEIQAMERVLEEQAATREKDVAEITRFFEDLTKTIESRLDASTNRALVEPYAREIIEHTTRLGETTRARASGAIEEEQARIAREVSTKTAEMRQCLDAFFREEALNADTWAFSMKHSGETASVTGVFTNAVGIETAFELGRDQWSVPRKVSDFASGVEVQIGMKKRFLRSSMVPETVNLDDWVIGSIEMSETVSEIGLRRNPRDAEDSVVFRVEDSGGEGGGGIHSAEIVKAVGSETEYPQPVERDDVPKLQQLVAGLRRAVDPMNATRKRLLWVKLHDEDVLENDLLILLLDRIIEQYAAVAIEISRRSPNPNELSLKREHDDGRREEIYLKKEDVFAPLKTLPEHLRNMFARLGIVPRSSMPAPPPRSIPPNTT